MTLHMSLQTSGKYSRKRKPSAEALRLKHVLFVERMWQKGQLEQREQGGRAEERPKRGEAPGHIQGPIDDYNKEVGSHSSPGRLENFSKFPRAKEEPELTRGQPSSKASAVSGTPSYNAPCLPEEGKTQAASVRSKCRHS